MKKFYILLIALCLENGAMAQWYFPNPSDTVNYNAMFFTDANTGYVANGSRILKTTDGGMHWIQQLNAGGWQIMALFFPDANTGYAFEATGPYDGYILKTTSGGSDWIIISYPSSAVYTLFFTDAITGYSAGNKILKTSDGGANWIVQRDSSDWILSMHFIDANTGYAVGGGNTFPLGSYRTILKTIDGGINWITILDEYGWILSSVFFTSADTGYVTGGPDILKTTDGGTNWINISYGTDSAFYQSVYFTDANTGYAVGNKYVNSDPLIIKTTDGGTNWLVQSIIQSNGQIIPNSVYFPVADTGYIISDRGILKTENGGGFPVGMDDQNKTTCKISLYPNPSSTSITILTSTPPNKNTFMVICNLNGQQLFKYQITEQQTVVDVAGLPQGVYFVRVVNDNSVNVGKFVKE
jgi:photosystem II stability/assembly factor-like uncharacterized protein